MNNDNYICLNGSGVISTIKITFNHGEKTWIKKIPLIPCTTCNYCAKVCPKNIGISGLFTAMNLACESIIAYLKVRPNLGRDNKDYNALFISSQKKRISKRTVQTIIKNEMEQILQESKKDFCHPHVLRHTGTSLLYNENDVDVFVLKVMLGHTSIKATEIYTHISDKKLKYIMDNCTISSIIERERSKEDE